MRFRNKTLYIFRYGFKTDELNGGDKKNWK